MTYTVTKEIEFDAGHRVPNHKSKCKNPHGHRYRVLATVAGPLGDEPGASDEGMVVDFSDLKALLTQVHDEFDHGFIVYEGDWQLHRALAHEEWKVRSVMFVPTAENLARYIYEFIDAQITWPGCKLVEVQVFETPTSVARYGV